MYEKTQENPLEGLPMTVLHWDHFKNSSEVIGLEENPYPCTELQKGGTFWKNTRKLIQDRLHMKILCVEKASLI